NNVEIEPETMLMTVRTRCIEIVNDASMIDFTDRNKDEPHEATRQS
ncbi:789_t:CDS:1, partial [Racocetra fulgida]